MQSIKHGHPVGIFRRVVRAKCLRYHGHVFYFTVDYFSNISVNIHNNRVSGIFAAVFERPVFNADLLDYTPLLSKLLLHKFTSTTNNKDLPGVSILKVRIS